MEEATRLFAPPRLRGYQPQDIADATATRPALYHFGREDRSPG
jgi:hypothetical protein